MTWVAAAIESFQAVWLLCKKNRESQYGIEEATSNGCYATDEYHIYIYYIYICEMLETAKAVRISLQATVSQNHYSPETSWYFQELLPCAWFAELNSKQWTLEVRFGCAELPVFGNDILTSFNHRSRNHQLFEAAGCVNDPRRLW